MSTIVLATFFGTWEAFMQAARAISYPRSRKFRLTGGIESWIVSAAAAATSMLFWLLSKLMAI